MLLAQAGSPKPLDRMLALGAASKFRTLLREHHALEEAKFLPLIARLEWAADARELVGEHRAGEDLVDRIVASLRQDDRSGALSGARDLAAALHGHVEHEGRIFEHLEAEA